MTDVSLSWASYPPIPALLIALRAAWPPAELRLAKERRDVVIDLTAHEPLAVLAPNSLHAIALATDGDAFLVVPLIRPGANGDPWRLAVPGDGLSAFLAGVPTASERPIGVDQTNESVVVGERVIMKWFRRVGPKASRATVLVGHLEAVGYRGIPKPLGTVDWLSPAGEALTLAQGAAYLPGTRDGWEWCVEEVQHRFDPSLGTRLGKLTADLHAALSTPSSVIPEPIKEAGPAELAAWRDAAVEALESAVALTEGDAGAELRGFVPAMRQVLDALPTDQAVPIQPVHGDLHVGQVLDWSGGLAVIDFDGNPTLSDDANRIRQPRERDVAQMLLSLDHVGRIVDKRSGWTRTAEIEAWIGGTRAAFLAAAGPVDHPLLAAFEVEQECRELVYAGRFLPRWRYAPMATLRARYAR